MNKYKFGVLLLAIPFFMEITATALAADFNFPQTAFSEVKPSAEQNTPSWLDKFIPQIKEMQGESIKPQKSTFHLEEKVVDPRAKVLKAYLARYNSPLENEAYSFISAADQYGLDWRLVAAISGVESTFGKFVPGGPDYGSYNAWGWGVYGDQAIYFKSWSEGIYTVSAGLKENYVSRGYTDPYEINRMYSTSSAWGDHVSYFLDDIDRFEQEYKQKETAQAAPIIMPKTAGSSGLLAMR